MPTERFRVLLQSPAGLDFVTHLNLPDAITWLATAPGVLTERCSSSATNRDALMQMKEARLDQLVIVDEEGRLQRVVERDQLVAAILLAAS
jgi:CBS-domain-containing membrane protein